MDEATSRPAVKAVAFDVNGTLFSLDSLRSAFTAAAVTAAMRQLDPHPMSNRRCGPSHNAGIPAVTVTNGGVEVV